MGIEKDLSAILPYGVQSPTNAHTAPVITDLILEGDAQAHLR